MYRRTWIGLLVCGCVAGCDVELGDTTMGELGQVEFAYSSNCLFGCTLDHPLLPGTSARISVSEPGDVPGLEASTTPADIATAVVEQSCYCERSGDGWAEGASVGPDDSCETGFTKRCDNDIVVTAHAPGDCQLELRTPEGGLLVDRTTLFVRNPRSAWFEHFGAGGEASSVADIQLLVGQREAVRVRLEDDEGRAMLVTGSVEWTISDGSVAGFPQWLGAPLDTIVTDDIADVQAVAPGSAVLTMRAGGLEHSATLHVSP